MRTIALLLFAWTLAGCAGAQARPAPWTGPTYTRAGIADLSTAELAARLLPPEQAADVLSHSIRRSVYHQGQDLQAIDFYRSLYVLASDICLRERIMVQFTDPERRRPAQTALDLPKRVREVVRLPEIARVQNCADVPGRRFAHLYGDLSLADGVKILRTLNAVRELAEGTQPLPYRLRCRPIRGEIGDCTAEDRAALAALPVHAAYQVLRGRRGFAARQPDDILGGDLVLIDREGPGYWQVRMIDMDGPGATVLLSAAGWVVH